MLNLESMMLIRQSSEDRLGRSTLMATRPEPVRLQFCQEEAKTDNVFAQLREAQHQRTEIRG